MCGPSQVIVLLKGMAEGRGTGIIDLLINKEEMGPFLSLRVPWFRWSFFSSHFADSTEIILC